jgi:hypothetical protein
VSNEIEIKTANDLDNIRNNLLGNYKLTANISLSSFGNWQPIGTREAPFKGRLNGNGYKITDLVVQWSSKSGNQFRLPDLFIVASPYIKKIAKCHDNDYTT